MTTEDDFHRALDANPDDHHTRLVFADWLQERGDPRAEGYRALGQNRFCPRLNGPYANTPVEWWYGLDVDTKEFHPAHLPLEWFSRIKCPNPYVVRDEVLSLDFACRRAAEDAAARAFPLVPAPLRASLLSGELAV